MSIYTDDMHQISGLGGDYERACREGVETASMWIVLHPGRTPHVKGKDGDGGYVQGENEDGIAFISAIDVTPFVMDDGRHVKLGDVLTPLQYHYIFQHVTLISELGVAEYQRRMRLGNLHANGEAQ